MKVERRCNKIVLYWGENEIHKIRDKRTPFFLPPSTCVGAGCTWALQVFLDFLYCSLVDVSWLLPSYLLLLVATLFGGHVGLSLMQLPFYPPLRAFTSWVVLYFNQEGFSSLHLKQRQYHAMLCCVVLCCIVLCCVVECCVVNGCGVLSHLLEGIGCGSLGKLPGLSSSDSGSRSSFSSGMRGLGGRCGRFGGIVSRTGGCVGSVGGSRCGSGSFLGLKEK